ncbi:hypothetical protein [Ichthyobacterium seriolicida]|uniref:Pkd domain containing protein n=1 Tax=Ichthyobacterium seriolicida TaxID=242600 RepID=A0A1J1E5T5_9FLAO|nr:hypothetical protein [Ichthyobacterium seriolicida]BAV95420.1 pkd domain containing protein [Ichthyobacterium seriolicida]
MITKTFYFTTLKSVFYFAFLSLFILSCTKNNKFKNNDSGECSISKFILEKSKNEGKIFANRIGVIDENLTPPTITLHLSESATLSGLKPTIIHSGVSFSPNEKKKVPFSASFSMEHNEKKEVTFSSNSAEYTVIGKNGQKKVYKVIIIKDLKSSKLISFKFKAEGDNLSTGKIVKELDGVISTTDSDNNTITINVPHDANVSSLIPTIEIYGNGKVNPESGIPQNFESAKTISYVITGEDGTIATYNVGVIKNSEPRIKTLIFDINNSENLNKNLGNSNVVGTINHDDNTIMVTVPYNADRGDLLPTITADNDNLAGTEIYSGDTGNSPITSVRFIDSEINPIKYTAVGPAGGRKVYNVSVYREQRINGLKSSKDQNAIDRSSIDMTDYISVTSLLGGPFTEEYKRIQSRGDREAFKKRIPNP